MKSYSFRPKYHRIIAVFETNELSAVNQKSVRDNLRYKHEFLSVTNWLVELIIVVVGAAIGFIGAILAVYLASKRQQKKEKEVKEGIYSDKLNYLRSLVLKSDQGITRQNKYFQEYEQKIKENPFELPLLKTVLLNELHIVVNKLDQEHYYHAYLNKFGNGNSIIDEFGAITSSLNYFYESINLLKDSSKRSLELDYERKTKLKGVLNNLEEECAGILKNTEIKESNHDFWTCVNSIFYTFQLKEQPNFEYILQHFVTPLKEGISQYVKTVSIAHSLILQCRKATILFFEISTHNERVADDFRRQYSKMSVDIQEFRVKIQRLKDFNSG